MTGRVVRTFAGRLLEPEVPGTECPIRQGPIFIIGLLQNREATMRRSERA